MSFTGLFVLAPDFDLYPASDVEVAERARMGCAEGDFILSRVGSRSGSKVLDRQMAHALTQLAHPARIVDAVLSVSTRFGVDPEAALDAMLPGLTRLMAEGFVVRADARILRERRALPSGSAVGECEVIACLHAMDDTEVYQVRLLDGSLGALKLCREGSEMGRENILNEAQILERLRGSFIPRLLDRGEFEGRPYLIAEWRRGSNASLVAAELRALDPEQRRQAQINLCTSIAEVYSRLHGSAVLHGDVHDGNLLIDTQGQVAILDYGIARDMQDATSNPPRGAAGHAWEPEYAQAILAGDEPPPATPAGEQFLIAALLFELLTGVTYADFSYEREKALRQIVDDAPRTFAECGVEPWPDVERVLQRALSKGPGDRYPNTTDFAEALRLTEPAHRHSLTIRSHIRTTHQTRRFDAWISELADFTGDPSRGVGRPPYASFAYGAAGVAYALLRVAQQEDRPQLLAAADLWSEHAMWSARRDGDEAFGDSELTSESVGPASLYFSRPGVHTVRALVGLARGDVRALTRATHALERSALVCGNSFDLALGAPGLVLASAILLDSTPSSSTAARRLQALGDRHVPSMWDSARALPDVRVATETSLGVAHGWGGLIYATLRWHLATDGDLPNECTARLEQLAALAEPIGRGVRFPWRSESDTPSDRSSEVRYMSGWCNGSAGFVHLWLAAAEALNNDNYRELAELSSWHAWEDDSEEDATLCCGLAGRAYALLAWYRASRDAAWLRRACELVAQGKASLDHDAALDPALLKGHLSLALIEREIGQPHLARMPLFEAEGWPMRGKHCRHGSYDR